MLEWEEDDEGMMKRYYSSKQQQKRAIPTPTIVIDVSRFFLLVSASKTT